MLFASPFLASLAGGPTKTDTGDTSVVVDLDHAGSFDAGSSWFGPYTGNVKFRLYCCE